MNILCLASYEKGHEFLRQAKRQGCGVLLVTSVSLQGKAEWPAEAIDEIFYMPDQDHAWNRADTIKAVSYLARTRPIDRVVALDDFDVDMAASLREHLRLPGMGETTVRHFRDKLAMRMQARESGINVPDFVHVLNYDALRRFMDHTPAPWVLKPRSMAGAIGIKKIHRAEDFWPAIELLGDLQSFYLLEQFVPGDIFQDLKSTRLNSSHLGISYAVFCLKKKKNTYQPKSLSLSALGLTLTFSWDTVS